MSALTGIEKRILEALGPDCGFEALALELFEFQREHNEPYRNYCGDAKPSRWFEIPAVPQAAFKTYPLRCFPEEETVRTFQTSGTTGAGAGLHHFASLELYEAAILQGWEAMRLPVLPRLVLIPEGRHAPQSSLSHMMSTLRKLPGGHRQHEGFTLDGGLLLDKIIHFLGHHERTGEPLMVLGTALSFLHLFERLDEKQRRFVLPPGSFGWETGGYKGTHRDLPKAELYGMFQAYLGLASERVINEYGMTELSSQFYATGLDAPHRGPAWVRGLVVNPETGEPCRLGETGILRIYDLANTGSVMAVETQDLAVAAEDGFYLIGRDPAALPRGCSRGADELLSQR